MRKAVVIATTELLTFTEERTLEIAGMEEWDCRFLLEIIFEQLGKKGSTSLNNLTKRVIDRIGFTHFYNLEYPVDAIKLMFQLVEKVNFELKILSLNEIDLCFEQWLGKDMIVSFPVEPIKYLTKLE